MHRSGAILPSGLAGDVRPALPSSEGGAACQVSTSNCSTGVGVVGAEPHQQCERPVTEQRASAAGGRPLVVGGAGAVLVERLVGDLRSKAADRRRSAERSSRAETHLQLAREDEARARGLEQALELLGLRRSP